MPRVRRYQLFFALGLFCLGTTYTTADCWYDDDKFAEGSEVQTAEPCLNCTCTKGALLCYLRVCPKLPNPPPLGCILLHRHRTCCPELICPDIPNDNALEARSEPDGLDVPLENTILGNACIVNGSVYGPGSAMDSSSLCEYCFCLKGQQTCLKPKCLLNIEGCIPVYDETSCCPTHYSCNSTLFTTTSTTAQPQLQGCVVDGVFYPEGSKVLGIGHSVCDNCYCINSILRCEPLSCAPPLHGCTPIVKPGECCAASYNCSGTIEIQPEPNYGQFPTISKEYSKLRKEIQKVVPLQAPMTEKTDPFYVIAESSGPLWAKPIRSPTNSGTTRQFTGNAFTLKPFFYAQTKLAETERLNRKVDNNTESEEATTELSTVPADFETSTTELTTEVTDFPTETETETTTEELTSTESNEPITLKTVLNSTDCIEHQNDTELRHSIETVTDVSSEELDETTLMSTTSQEDVTEVDLESRVKVSGVTLRNIAKIPDIEAILNSTKGKVEDYEYDYNEPSLPPSLPNLRIIPFVAADALDSKKEKLKETPVYAEERISNPGFEFNNFSPPVETEGGFVPKEPPILDHFYENSVTASSLPKQINCISKTEEVLHGSTVESDDPCMTCTCFYGNIVCQKLSCQIKCRQPCCLCQKAPNIVLNRLEPPVSQEAVTVAEGIVTHDPFKDVIRTKPAPDLQSLMGDMLLLSRKSTTEAMPTTSTPELSLDKMLEMLFNGEKLETTTTTVRVTENPTEREVPHITKDRDRENEEITDHMNRVEATKGVGFLKLAGCNIYGRMYRVGRIISELSGPCLECKCTEIGVQCKALKC